RHTRFSRDWSSDVCSSDLPARSGFELVDQLEPSPGPLDLAAGARGEALIGEALEGDGALAVGVRSVREPAVEHGAAHVLDMVEQIGRASCRERAEGGGVES